jgi:8-oxo-dGTP pyrophosphatase MutT (NUDIX family)
MYCVYGERNQKNKYKKILKEFHMTKQKIYRSGIIPYYIKEGEIHMFFMKPSDPKFGGDIFQIAKGKHEDGEDPQTAGIREGKEELGLFEGNITAIHNLGKFLGRTHVFICKIKDPEMFGEPHFETAETKWMTPEEFQAEGRDLHKPVVKATVRYITEVEELK